MSSDRIALTGLRAYGRHGVYDYERAEGQEFVVDITLQTDTARAARTDDLADTADYGDLADRAVAVITGEPASLLETVAARLAEVCLSYPGVRAAEVTVHKPQAPIRHAFADVAVTIRREAAGDDRGGGR